MGDELSVLRGQLNQRQQHALDCRHGLALGLDARGGLQLGVNRLIPTLHQCFQKSLAGAEVIDKAARIDLRAGDQLAHHQATQTFFCRQLQAMREQALARGLRAQGRATGRGGGFGQHVDILYGCINNAARVLSHDAQCVDGGGHVRWRGRRAQTGDIGVRMKSKQARVLVAALVLLALVALAALAVYAWRAPAPVTTLSGNVDIREVNLSFRVSGRLERLLVDEGDRVHAGDLLGELDAQPYRLAVAELAANRDAMLAHQSLYKQGYRQEDIEQARANVQARQAALALAQQTHQRQQDLALSGATAQRLLDDANSQRTQAQAQLESARQQLHALSSGYRKQEVQEAQANAQRAQAQVEQAQLNVTDTQLRAPSDGTVITRAVEPGTMLQAGATVLTLSLDQPVWIRAYVGELDLGKLHPGMLVHVYSDSRTQPYDAVVGFISPTAEFTPKNVETQDLRTALVYRLRLIVRHPDAALRQGMAVTVKLDAHP